MTFNQNITSTTSTVRLQDFPNKISPIGLDIIYMGDSSNSLNEVQITMDNFLSNSPRVLVNSFNGIITCCPLIYTLGEISQSGNIITGVGTVFTSTNLSSGQIVRFNSGQTATVLNVVNDTTLFVDTSATIATSQYTMYYGGFQIDRNGNGSAQNFKSLQNIPTATVSNDFTVLSNNYMYLVNSLAGNINCGLIPANSIAGKSFIIKKTDSSSNNIIISASGSDKIDGASTYTLSGIASTHASVTLVSDGISNWSIISVV